MYYCIIRARQDRRKEEARIRIEAQKAARAEEARKYEEKKKRDDKLRLEENKIIEKEIQKMRKEIENQRIEINDKNQISKKEIIKKVHRDQQRQRQIHDEKMRKIQIKFQFEAKNKLIIEKRIEAHRAARLAVMKSAFEKWTQLLIHRRKQAGTAAAFYDFRKMKLILNRWKRFTKSEKEKRILHFEKHKAFRIQAYKSKRINSDKIKIISKYFHSWRVCVKRKKEIEILEKNEQETKVKL